MHINLTDTFRLQSKWSVGAEKIKSYFLIVSWPSCSKIQKQCSRKVPKVTSAEANTLSAVCSCPVSVCAVQPCHVQTDLQLTKTQRHMRDRGFICSSVIIRRLRLVTWEKVLGRAWENNILMLKHTYLDQHLNFHI